MNDIDDLLVLNGFKYIIQEQSLYFGDEVKYYELNQIELRLISSKSIFSIDIRIKKLEWFDLALVKNYILNEKELNKKSEVNELYDFLNKFLNKILELFDNVNYPKTETELKKLEILRVSQMFM